ncbi:Vng6404h (plasmid) [Halobacterium salinarum NRC-1]|jgi:hypothetical protein|uniref:Spurious ORF n=1 Tax=Halobacterium salinarum (strain ATCC 700922 / JCM 11081 / NRC-1) TaxID=64091 RepID=Q9HHG9_HALSA|nr:Vng6404h [Halobacterium salinarum NRC-1]DAC79981.1 TPA_inf: spurious ORF [Halobacterium salinarum NRC-1]
MSLRVVCLVARQALFCCVRHGSHRSPRSPLRVARDRPFRACGRSPHRPRPFRAKMDVPSTPAGKRGGLRGVAAHPPRFLRWPLAPGGSLEDSLRSSSKPCLAARGSRCSPLASPWPPAGQPRIARQDGARCWIVDLLGRALARAQEGAREGASESAQTVLSVVVR